MRFFYWLVAIPLTLIAVSFAVSNREAVTLEIWPVPYVLDMPLYLVGLGGLLLGFLSGGFISWISAGRARSRARQAERRVKEQDRELRDLRAQLLDIKRADEEAKASSAASLTTGKKENVREPQAATAITQ